MRPSQSARAGRAAGRGRRLRSSPRRPKINTRRGPTTACRGPAPGNAARIKSCFSTIGRRFSRRSPRRPSREKSAPSSRFRSNRETGRDYQRATSERSGVVRSPKAGKTSVDELTNRGSFRRFFHGRDCRVSPLGSVVPPWRDDPRVGKEDLRPGVAANSCNAPIRGAR